MRISLKSILVFASLALVLAACGQGQVASTPEPAEAAQAEEPTNTLAPTETPPLTGPRATAAALNEQVTLNAPTPVGGIEVEGPDDYVGLFQQAWNVINENYVRDNFNGVDWQGIYEEYLPKFEAVDNRDDHYELMTDLVLELNDNHSRYVPPDRMEAEFGVGSGGGSGLPWSGLIIWPAKEDEQLLIWGVCSIGPAAEAGLLRGDVIQAIDGVEVTKSDEDWESEDYRPAIFGNEGQSTVTLTVQQGPDADPKDVVLTLAGAGGCPSWFHEIVNESPRIGFVRVPNFAGDSSTNILAAINDLEADEPLDALIVDVRHNPGGNSDESVAIFVEGIVGTQGSFREGEQRTVYHIRGPVAWNDTTPVAVLTDGNSNSAADYFPTFMQELERATIIGMPSAGNTEGILQFILSDGTLLRLAVSSFALNDGSVLEGIGVTPDVVVPLGDWGLRQEPYDVQVQAAIDFLAGE